MGKTLLAFLVATFSIQEIVYAQSLPTETSRYNRGGSQYPGRYRDERGRVRRFPLIDEKTRLYDGGGRVIGTVQQAVMLNVGAIMDIVPSGENRSRTFLWAWATDAGLSGWIARDACGQNTRPNRSCRHNSLCMAMNYRFPADWLSLMSTSTSSG